MAIAREQVAACDVPRQEVEVEAIGGAVVVRGMDLPQLVRFRAMQRKVSAPMDGESDVAASERASGDLLPMVLEMCVVLDDGLPVYSAAQWGVFAVQHMTAAMELWEIAVRLSGQGQDPPNS